MASLHKDPRGKSPFWYAAYNVHNGEGNLVRKFRSTKTKNKKQAQEVLNAWVRARNIGSQLTPDRAREVIAAGVADVMATASGEKLEHATIRQWCKQWLLAKSVESEPRTHERYSLAIRHFLDSLGPKADQTLEALRAAHVIRFRDDTAKNLSVGSVNTDLKVIRACLYSAVKQDLLHKNVAASVSPLKERGQNKRRGFTLTEVQQILKACDKAGGEWRGLVLTAAYTGQRLGDVARLTFGQVDLEKNEISFVTEKTGKPLSFHIAKPLADHLHSLPSADNPKAYLFPQAGETAETRIGTLSNRFYEEILVPSNLVPARPKKHKSTGKGRDAKRTQSELSFHSFRHSLTTWLKAAGASNAMAQMIIGHDSEVVSRGYTHFGLEHGTQWIDKLPDITK